MHLVIFRNFQVIPVNLIEVSGFKPQKQELIKLGLNLWTLLHFNLQGRAVQTALSLEEGLKQVVHLNYIDQVSPEYHEKLVHLTGGLQTDKVSMV